MTMEVRVFSLWRRLTKQRFCQLVIGVLCWFLLLLMTGNWLTVSSVANNKEHPRGTNVTTKGSLRLLCWVVTQPMNHLTKAKAIKDTWGRRCDKLIFSSSQNDTFLPAIGFPIPGKETPDHLWNKAVFMIRHIYKNYLNDYDWFFKAHDDTYTIVENLRDYASSMDANLPWFVGRHFQYSPHNIRYLTGGPGYLLSRPTLRILVEEGLDQNTCPLLLGEQDDLIIGKCLERLGAVFADTRDSFGLQRFLHCHPLELYQQGSLCRNMTKEYDFYREKNSTQPFSDQVISLHHVAVDYMHLFEYFMYKLKIARPRSSQILET